MFDHTSTSEKAARELQKYSNRELSELWDEIAAMEANREVNIVRDWISAELERRMGNDLFEAWLVDFSGEDGNPVPAIGYLNHK